MKRSIVILTALAALAFSSVAPAGEKKLSFDDVNTKFAANLEMWFGKKTPMPEKIQMAYDLGFRAVEFWPFWKRDIDAIDAKCRELGMEVVQFTAWGQSLGSGEHTDAFVAQIKDAIKAAKKLGAKKFTVTGHRWVEGYTAEQQIANYTEAMKRVAPLCEEAGVMLIIEPFNPVDHGKNFLDGSKEAVKICREINSPAIKINWDFYHMQLTEGALIHHLREGYDQVGYLQLGDTPGRFQPGTGELNYKAILKAAWDLGYRGYVGVECKTKGTPAEAVQQLLQNAY
ncbi:MAG: TIM barrel protein [Verrucomicrobiota bacterium]